MAHQNAKGGLVCASHSPLLHCFVTPPAEWDAMQRVFASLRTRVDALDPDLIVIFGADHFNGFFLDAMPAFCVGLDAEATSDIGGSPGRLDVPTALATDLVASVRAQGVDPGVSYRMTVDHAFSQTIDILTGDIARVPTIPIFVSCVTRPFVPFARARAMGEAVGRFVADLGGTTLFVASGGMSHHPARYYPDPADAEPPVAEWEITGGRGAESMSRAAWLERLEVMHHEGAEMIARGERTAADMRINERLDREFIERLCALDVEGFDSWDVGSMVEEAGIGSTELLTWVAAAAAHSIGGGRTPELDLYTVAPEIGIGFGVVSAFSTDGADGLGDRAVQAPNAQPD